ncbi:MAG: LysM peptidoglycan-binding domain-containing protein [Acidobacteria bacterium]|nr:MAG: LysM peptidoglycan-binding domain-containing protein [Acidobacteriota bacterium]REK01105.1 MAG: LysM peptidoglycan-binding domain-containing protein [Acidobacteriota bacterium]
MSPLAFAQLRRSTPTPVALLVAGLLLLGLTSTTAAAGAQAIDPRLDADLFPVPESLVPAVRFWQDIFGRYESTQVVIHDDEHLDVVYSVVDVSDLTLSGLSDLQKARERQRRVRDAMDDARAVIRALNGDGRVAVDGAQLARARAVWNAVPNGDRYLRTAGSRVRSQAGLRDRFAEAIQTAGMFMPGIRAALREHGVPEEIACLPFVESMFNYKARSKVGASGAWQFTRSTGVMFLQIDSAVDARSDVLLAADGAARMLRRGYENLKSWPITLTGYNHGMAGMANAVRRLGTRDIGRVVQEYQSRTFGFASRNFYAEFVAAFLTYSDRERLFPGIQPLPERRFDELRLDRYVSLLDMAVLGQASELQLIELNPALSSEVHRGTLLIPPGYPLRVPEGTRAQFERAYERIPEDRRRTRQLASQHRVASGDTVGSIAARYGTTVAAIQRANNLPRADRIYVGQVLEVPTHGAGSSNWRVRLDPAELDGSATSIAVARASSGEASGPEPPAVSTAAGAAGDSSLQVHTVRRGEALSSIASRYGVSASLLVRSNDLASPDRIHVGQRLVIPPSGTRLHTVRSGDTLGAIAERYATTVTALMRANRLDSSVIRVGQVLAVPPARGG